MHRSCLGIFLSPSIQDLKAPCPGRTMCDDLEISLGKLEITSSACKF